MWIITVCVVPTLKHGAEGVKVWRAIYAKFKAHKPTWHSVEWSMWFVLSGNRNNSMTVTHNTPQGYVRDISLRMKVMHDLAFIIS